MSRRPIVVGIISSTLDLHRQYRESDRSAVGAVGKFLAKIGDDAKLAVKSVALGSWIITIM